MNNLNLSRNQAVRPHAGCFSVLILLAGLLAVVTPLRADNPPTYLFQIDSSAVHGGFQPNFVVLDSSNNVYVTDTPNNRVVIFAGNETYLTQWGSYGSGNGQLDNPYGVAVDRSNDVYVADYYNSRIEKFDSNGNYLTQWGSYGTGNGQFEYPQGVAVDSSSNVYVADTGNYLSNNRIEKFSSSGKYLTQWGSLGTNNGQFENPHGVAVDSSSNVYVADTGNNRIEKFSSSGTYLAQWGSPGTNNGQFGSPGDVAVDSSNHVYVADPGNFRVEKFDSNGNYLTQWGSYGSGNGQFSSRLGVAVDSSGNFIYVADYHNSRIEVFVNNPNIVSPIITQQPTDQTVVAGVNVTFSVGVVGTAPFSYQWNSNNVVVPGATDATFTLTNVNLSASNSTYSVLVTNSFGSELSSNAELAVLPALVTTQPASGLSATGAVLNGSVTVGPDETVVWFDWGTDTSYGNITGAIIVPGNNASNTISAPLNELPGNFYHYRVDAANDFGIVYGGDQVFTVGFAPSATTLPPTNGANGATLNAAVNPEGWDTTVYFQWATPTLTNTTPGINIGAGAASVNVSSFVPGLSASTSYLYQVVASNALGTAFGEAAYKGLDQHRYFFSGSETNITLPPGTYIITAYGAPGGNTVNTLRLGGYGAEMSGEFNFSTATTLTLLVGGGGEPAYYVASYDTPSSIAGGGGGGSFVVESNTPLVIAGGGGGYGGDGGFLGNGGDGNASTNGGGGGGFHLYAGGGGTGGGGGGGGRYEPGGGGGGGGFLGNGGDGTNGYVGSAYGGGGGFSFENGGNGGYPYYGNHNNFGVGYGGYGGGGGGAYQTSWNYSYGYGGGGGGGYSGGGGGAGGGGGGGGGGSIIDSSAIAILAEVSHFGYYSPDDPTNGEIIIIAVPTPLAISTTDAAFGFTNGVFGFNVTGPSGSNVVIQASTDLQTWIPLQTNLLRSGLLYFSDPQSPTNVKRFYRAQFSP